VLAVGFHKYFYGTSFLKSNHSQILEILSGNVVKISQYIRIITTIT